MHKAILGTAISVAFTALETVLNLLITAYSFVNATGENAIAAVRTQTAALRKSIDEAVDGLP